MGSEIIEDQHVAGPQHRQEDLPDLGLEDLGVGRPFDGHTGGGAIQAHQSDHRGSVPVAARGMADQTLAFGGSAAQARQVWLGRRLVEEDQPGGVQPALAPPPRLGDVRPVFFGRMERLFLYASPSRPSTQWNAPMLQFSSSRCLISTSVSSGSFATSRFIRLPCAGSSFALRPQYRYLGRRSPVRSFCANSFLTSPSDT